MGGAPPCSYHGVPSSLPPVPRMMFLNALVHYAGSTAAAGKALEDLLRRAAETAEDAGARTRLAAWATGLAKPERAAGGGAPQRGCNL